MFKVNNKVILTNLTGVNQVSLLLTLNSRLFAGFTGHIYLISY